MAVQIGVREMRAGLKTVLDRVAAGEEIAVVRRGVEVARLVPPPTAGKARLPALASFREQQEATGEPLSAEVIAAREEERF